MAINDLTQELQKDARLDGALEKRICDAVLERLQRDTCNDVQAISVKWLVLNIMSYLGARVPMCVCELMLHPPPSLSVLATRIQETHVIDVAQKLSEHILRGKAELRCVALLVWVYGLSHSRLYLLVDCCSDIYSIGLKTLIADLPVSTGERIAAVRTPYFPLLLFFPLICPAHNLTTADLWWPAGWFNLRGLRGCVRVSGHLYRAPQPLRWQNGAGAC